MNGPALSPIHILLTLLAGVSALLRDGEAVPLVSPWAMAAMQLPGLVCLIAGRRRSGSRVDMGITAIVLIGAAVAGIRLGTVDAWVVAVALFLNGMLMLDVGRRWYFVMEEAVDRPRDVLRSVWRAWFIGLLVCTLLLCLPVATRSSVPDYRHNFWNHVLNSGFASAGSACLVGTSIYSFAEDYSLFGQAVLLLMTQLAGLGLAAVGLSIGRPFLTRRCSLRAVWAWLMLLQLIGAVALSPAWSSADAPTPLARVAWGFVHSSSAIWNTGYVLRSNGLAEYLRNPVVFSVITMLAIAGSLGMPIVLDLVSLRSKDQATVFEPWQRLPSWETGVTFVLLVGVAALLFLFETRGFLPDNLAPSRPFDLGSSQVPLREESDHAPRWRMAVFQSATLRSAGIQSIPLCEGAISWPSYGVLLVGMLIGGTALGVGGGFRTSAIVLGAICILHPRRFWSDASQQVRWRTVRRIAILVGGFLLLAACGVVVLFLCTAGTAHEWIFEPIAAVSGVGLSTGLSLHLTWIGRLAMIGLMIVGRWMPLLVWCRIAADFTGVAAVAMARPRKT